MSKHSIPAQKRYIIALGGSIIAPNSINTRFIKKFRRFLIAFLQQNRKFVLVIGGGKICRQYQKAISRILEASNKDKDLIGIRATYLNAELVRTALKDFAWPQILTPDDKIVKNANLIIGAGWRPGWSTDYVAVAWAKKLKENLVIIAGRPDYVYSKDPKHQDARPISQMSWLEYGKICRRKWQPGVSAPVDPVAAKLAQKEKIKAVVLDGAKLENLADLFEGKKFKGTIIK
ncbi:MAG: UMP kinase [bacterium]